MISQNWLLAPLLALLLGVAGLAAAGIAFAGVRRQAEGNEIMRAIAREIRIGAMAFLRRQYAIVGGLVLALAALLLFAVGPWTAAAFVGGAVSSMLAGFMGITAATRANVRVAEAARVSGAAAALAVAFNGSAVMGLAVGSLGLLGLGLLYLFGIYLIGFPTQEEVLRFAEAVAGYAMGASTVALFARISGGVFTKAADVGADLVGKSEEGLPEDDPRNPAVIADSVGDNVGDVAGMGADLFESYIGATVATIAIGASSALYAQLRFEAIVLPILLVTGGLVASIVGIGMVRAGVGGRQGAAASLRYAVWGSTAAFLLLALLIVWLLGMDAIEDPATGRLRRFDGPFWAVLSGSVLGIGIGLVSEYYTASHPVRRIARAAETGPATAVMAGLAVGMESVAVPLLLICIAIGAAFFFAGIYGVGLAAVGMLATVAIVMAVEAFGPIADNAGGIAEMAHLGPEARAITENLDAAGSSTSAVGKGFAIGSAALTSLALFGAYATVVDLAAINLADPFVTIGFLLGGVIPFYTAALTLAAVGRAATTMVEEVRRQFREIAGLLQGTAQPDSARCVDIANRAALREMILPGLIGVLAPVLVGAFLGLPALGGMLAGATLTGVLLALFMAHSGEAWDNAKKQIEAGALGGPGSEAHRAIVVGDTVGDPFKDTAGPAMNILIKLMAIVSLVISPWLVRWWNREGTQAEEMDALAPWIEGAGQALAHAAALLGAWLG